MVKKRRQTYPPPRSSKGPAPVYVPPVTPPTVALINNQAGTGRTGIEVGMRVSILGTGLYVGEVAVVESIAGGVIPAANVRTEAGRTRRVRTIDLAPAPSATAVEPPKPIAESLDQ
jgi:hypothetical protein